jgi:hypothetical protein
MDEDCETTLFMDEKKHLDVNVGCLYPITK